MITLSAPAKVNLWLRLGEVRPDGYQELDTAFAPLALADEVEVESGGPRQTCSVEPMDSGSPPVGEIPTGPKNLAWRAARAFMDRMGEPGRGFAVRLRKAIPAGAGLGGGSSDAAAVLRALSRLHPDGLTADDLHEIAAGLGSDVAFFLLDKPARGRGRGEILESFAPDNVPWEGPLLLIKPPFGVSTAWAYQAHRARSSTEDSTSSDFVSLWQNDLEEAVFGKFLILSTLKDWLLRQRGVIAAMMCGSGSTILAALEDDDAGSRLLPAVKEEFGSTLWACLTRTASIASAP